MIKLLIATQNRGKIAELKNLFAEIPVSVIDLSSFPELPAPEETGKTFAANASLKADYYAEKTGLTALADDSGLEVDALGGAPGIFSARYGGTNASDADRISKLLSELKDFPSQKRTARFVCAIAVSQGIGKTLKIVEGICGGHIAFEASGSNGFGYDPIFIPEDFTETFAQLSPLVKQKISHRAIATSKIVAFLRDFTVL